MPDGRLDESPAWGYKIQAPPAARRPSPSRSLAMGAAVNACPPARTLERLLAEQLAGFERESVETHVEGCPACQDQLESLVARTSPDARPPAKPADSAHAPGDGFLSRLRDLAPPRAGGGHAVGPGGAGLPVPGRLGPYEVL